MHVVVIWRFLNALCPVNSLRSGGEIYLLNTTLAKKQFPFSMKWQPNSTPSYGGARIKDPYAVDKKSIGWSLFSSSAPLWAESCWLGDQPYLNRISLFELGSRLRIQLAPIRWNDVKFSVSRFNRFSNPSVWDDETSSFQHMEAGEKICFFCFIGFS